MVSLIPTFSLSHMRQAWTLLHCPPWGGRKAGQMFWNPLVAFRRSIARAGRSLLDTRGRCDTSSFPKGPFPQRCQAPEQWSSEGLATTANRHKVGNDPKNGNYVFLLTPSCHWWFTSFSGGKKTKRVTAMLPVWRDLKTCSDFRQVQNLK